MTTQPDSVTWPIVDPGVIELPERDIHVWRVPLDLPGSMVDAYRGYLVADEKERAARYLSNVDGDRFTVCRAAQRLILAGYLSRAPLELPFQYSPLGKPALGETSDLQFNVANSKSLALIALTRGPELGVDVEQSRAVRDMIGLARHYFADEEVATLQALEDSDDRQVAFFRAWTRKEALLKATGTGLTFPLRDVTVSLRQGDPCRVTRFGGDNPADWSLFHLEPQAGFVAALALRGTVNEVKTMTWGGMKAKGGRLKEGERRKEEGGK